MVMAGACIGTGGWLSNVQTQGQAGGGALASETRLTASLRQERGEDEGKRGGGGGS